MAKANHIILVVCLSAPSVVWGQETDRDYIRKGNHLFKDSAYVDAEINYRKALDANPKSTVSMYNLGNSLFQQQKAEEAIKQYDNAAKVEKNKTKLAKIYHNKGTLLQMTQDYAKAIEAYKAALRNNPKDDETRYNLALAQKLLKDPPPQQDQQNQQNQNQDQQDQQEKQEQQNQQDQQKQEENSMAKENAEQMLNSVMQDEKDVQDKVKKQTVIQGGKLEKDW
jgi:tetratricopeptide (TPR) repeat protein